MVLRIWLGKGYRNLKPTDTVKTLRAAYSFCNYNNLPMLLKANGGYCIISKQGKLIDICGTLDSISFGERYERIKKAS